MNGVSAVIDMGTAVTIHVTNGEGNEYTAAWEKTAEMLAPVNAVFAIGGGIQNIKDFRDPEKAKDMVNNAAQAFLTGMGFARDYIQDGTVLGVSSNIINGYREIVVRSSDTSDPEAAKEVLLKTGISEETLNNDVSSAQQTQEAYLGTEADVYIEAMGELVDTEEPLDIDAFIENVDNTFRECAVDEGAETEEEIVPKTEANDRYAWYLVKSEVTRKPENVSEGDKIETYDVSETSRAIYLQNKNMDGKIEKATFTVNCENPPSVIYADKEYSLHLSITADGETEFYFRNNTWITDGYGKLETKDGKGTFVVGTHEGDDKSFDVTVYGIRGAGGEGSTFELKLVGSGCDTTWTYEWKKMGSN